MLVLVWAFTARAHEGIGHTPGRSRPHPISIGSRCACASRCRGEVPRGKEARSTRYRHCNRNHAKARAPDPPHQGKEAWWYYGFAHGQHISFYARETLAYIARQQGVFLVSHNGLHLFSQRKISPFVFATLVRLAHRGAFWILKRLLGSKTLSDHQLLSPSSRPAPN